MSIDIEDIKIIRIVKKSKFLQSLGFGLLIGAGSRGLMGLVYGKRGGFTALGHAALGAIYYGAMGLLVGGTLGFASGIDKTIQLEGMTDLEI